MIRAALQQLALAASHARKLPLPKAPSFHTAAATTNAMQQLLLPRLQQLPAGCSQQPIATTAHAVRPVSLPQQQQHRAAVALHWGPLQPCTCWVVQQLNGRQKHAGSSIHTSVGQRFVATRSTSASAAPGETDTIAAVRRLYDAAANRLSQALQLADVAGTKARLAALQNDAASESIWDDPAKAQALVTEISGLKEELATVESFQAHLDDAAFALELADLEADGSSSSSTANSTAAAAASELASLLGQAKSSLQQLSAGLDKWELRMLLSGPYDEAGALLTITAGAGGVDAMDWAEMLERMYTRWAADQGFSCSTSDRSVGEEAGIKGVELAIRGRWAYGYLKGEKGTHRLVRSSPFNAKGLRQTSFAGVEVLPLLDEAADSQKQSKLVIPDKDLEVSFMRSGGKGGQNVNKVETGVRMVHTPTGLAVKCTEHRTQQQNRATALERLTAKLLVVLEEQQAQALADIRGDIVKAEWGQQIRNYVFHPYKMVKDTRSGCETSDVQAVMDGELNEFISTYLRHKSKQQQEARLAAPTA